MVENKADLAAAQRGAALHRTAHHRARQYHRGETTQTINPDMTLRKTSDLGK